MNASEAEGRLTPACTLGSSEAWLAHTGVSHQSEQLTRQKVRSCAHQALAQSDWPAAPPWHP